jgi:hypothetical protein
MPQITIYLDKETERKARSAAKRSGKSLSAWLRQRIEAMPEEDWPADFGRLFGSMDDARFVAPKRAKADPVEW